MKEQLLEQMGGVVGAHHGGAEKQETDEQNPVTTFVEHMNLGFEYSMSSDSVSRPCTARCLRRLWVLFLLIQSNLAGVAAESNHPAFSARAARDENVRGLPVLLRLEFVNNGVQDFYFQRSIGWGDGIQILASKPGGKRTYVRRDTPVRDMGMDAMPAPIYRFEGQCAPKECQVILQMLDTAGLELGSTQMSLELLHNTSKAVESYEASVEILLVETNSSSVGDLDLDQKLLASIVCRFHNHFGKCGRSSSVPTMSRKVLQSKDLEIEAEYVLYAGVLQGIARDATNDDRALAKETARAFIERFPKSWLRAHVYAALVMIHRKEGDTEAAERALKAGQALPESYPLFQNLGLVEEPVAPEDKN